MPTTPPYNDDDFKLHVVDVLSELKSGQANLNTRLFGGEGQDGALKYLMNHIKEVSDDSIKRDEKLESSNKELSKKYDELSTKVTWFSGAGAAAGAFIGYAISLFKHH